MRCNVREFVLSVAVSIFQVLITIHEWTESPENKSETLKLHIYHDNFTDLKVKESSMIRQARQESESECNESGSEG